MRDWLENLNKINGSEVVMGNNVSWKVEGTGSVTLKFENGYIYTLERVKYILELNTNFISMGDLDDIGLHGKLGDGMLKVMRGSLVMFKGVIRNGIHVIKAEIVKKAIFEASLLLKLMPL